ncbi:MAG: hypothetical protein A3G49_01045 [Candidatus Sungbacteria bacterium RIFCSPLOWO2_12_FULL_41_11]|uniref:Uncharacterized protein n=1 Tax=Candidatus Sungbacteria bacterium RIFCSPLOWO2_12_FULL_41_11 TaxID=1802286 RepID=A0A1G2LRJ3_9BACT|nr:MAG: hypothetical protein UV01_C0006G0037 [Parcubacteria group bacterium GW2011_GWA2_42_14]OGZ97412.1 MAG: hypothetical protein A3D41_05595 [Candidatus Sungbacteria bacterium RIFCSPHIGHO2_02_FULL_41_12b]OHA13411.1 MAG: hypothetical protein A3G49_01045 [Candidatus Sungbacteria bacterium RIFCSPLOWO2_12_FULL_41_11]
MELSLGEFVRFLILLMQRNDVKFSFLSLRPWHLLFYRLKKMPETEGKPKFFENLSFNWDGAYPESPELSGFLSALCWIGCIITVSPEFKEYKLSEGVERIWLERLEPLGGEANQFLNKALLFAREEFRDFNRSSAK